MHLQCLRLRKIQLESLLWTDKEKSVEAGLAPLLPNAWPSQLHTFTTCVNSICVLWKFQNYRAAKMGNEYSKR